MITKRIITAFLGLLFVSAFILGKPFFAKADSSKIISASFLPMPHESLPVSGYLNATNTGFRINAQLNSTYKPDNLAIFLDNDLAPLDQRVYDNGLSYEFSSNTKSLPELKTLLDYNNSLASKAHKISLKALENLNGSWVDLWSYNFTADFNAPSGEIYYGMSKKEPALSPYIIFKFVPDNETKDVHSVTFGFNGKNYPGVKNPDRTYEYKLTIVNGVGDYNGNGQITATVTDFAGNASSLSIAAPFTIDATAPQIEIVSPVNSKTYSAKDIKLIYNLNDPDAGVVIRLNGQIVSIKNGETFRNLPDGEYTLEIEAFDFAQNKTTAMSKFKVDTTPPAYTITHRSDGANILPEGEVIIDGTTEPGAKVTLEIPSSNVVMETFADQNGNFKFNFLANELGAGSYEAFLTFTDEIGNLTRFKVADFKILPRRVAKLAMAQPLAIAAPVASDVSAQVIPIIPTDESTEVAEVAREGRINASQDTKEAGTNWGAWIILLAIVTLASALATAGYYGFEWLGIAKKQKSPAVEKNATFASKPQFEKKDEPKTPPDSKSEPSEEKKARW